jgi:hypothetical protein
MTETRPFWTGNPECYECHKEYEPLTGDGDGLCGPCYRGDAEDEDAAEDAAREEMHELVEWQRSLKGW